MKEKIYILYNIEAENAIAASYDKQLLEEIMCDDFMEDFIYECYMRTSGAFSVKYNTYADYCELIADIWDEIMNWYDFYIYIMESEII